MSQYKLISISKSNLEQEFDITKYIRNSYKNVILLNSLNKQRLLVHRILIEIILENGSS